MKITFEKNGKQRTADLSKPIDLSIPLKNGLDNPNCFWAPPVEYSPVVAGDFIGSTERGGPVNFFNIKFNPHGNGTHTECVGHIALERYVLHECLQQAHFLARLASIYPRPLENGDRVFYRDQFEEVLAPGEAEAFVLRSLPNDDLKKTRQYSGTNPPYVHHEAAQYLVDCGIQHFLLDLPSVDREEDGGQLLAHRAFWQYPHTVRRHCTITEMIFVPDTVKDGVYLLNLQTASFDLDVSPSKPVLFELTA